MDSADATPRLLAGRRGLILGVSAENSVGLACARVMSAMGAELAVTSRAARREVVEPLCRAAGWRWIAADYEADGSLATTFATLSQEWDRLDFVVHTLMHVPGEVVARPLVELSRRDFEDVVAVGAHSLVAACHEALPLLSASSSPRVVALTSGCSHRMTPNYHVAGIAKAALESTVLYLAWELGARGISCNAVSFSIVASDGATRLLGDKAIAQTRTLQARRAPTHRAVEADEVAEAVAWLCSARARNVTGEIITVDGGFARAYF